MISFQVHWQRHLKTFGIPWFALCCNAYLYCTIPLCFDIEDYIGRHHYQKSIFIQIDYFNTGQTSLILARLKGEKIPISSYPRLFGTSDKTTLEQHEVLMRRYEVSLYRARSKPWYTLLMINKYTERKMYSFSINVLVVLRLQIYRLIVIWLTVLIKMTRPPNTKYQHTALHYVHCLPLWHLFCTRYYSKLYFIITFFLLVKNLQESYIIKLNIQKDRINVQCIKIKQTWN